MHCYRLILIALAAALFAASAFAHDLSADNAEYVKQLAGAAPGPFLYLGAKHMFTGYDHLLFLVGVVFFLYRGRDVLLYVTLFTIGHSLTLLLGVWMQWQINSYLIDAIIGLSVAYKAFENIGGFKQVIQYTPNTQVAVFVFGLCHGLGLASRLQGYVGGESGLITNLISFNIGVELGQLAALGIILLLIVRWRQHTSFERHAFAANVILMFAGVLLAGNQLAGYLLL
ncbi:MAG: HupE/UreJ family protein [Halioglobus sp.]